MGVKTRALGWTVARESVELGRGRRQRVTHRSTDREWARRTVREEEKHEAGRLDVLLELRELDQVVGVKEDVHTVQKVHQLALDLLTLILAARPHVREDCEGG